MGSRLVRRVDAIIALLALTALLLAGGVFHVGGFELLLGVCCAYLGVGFVYWWLSDGGWGLDGTVES